MIMKKRSLLIRVSIFIGVLLVTEVCNVSVGRAAVQAQEKGAIENKKEETFYAGVNSFRGYFSEGLAAVSKEDNGEYKCGYIDKTGKEVIPFIYEGAEYLVKG